MTIELTVEHREGIRYWLNYVSNRCPWHQMTIELVEEHRKKLRKWLYDTPIRGPFRFVKPNQCSICQEWFPGCGENEGICPCDKYGCEAVTRVAWFMLEGV